MDWRGRRYYAVKRGYSKYSNDWNQIIHRIKTIPSVSIHFHNNIKCQQPTELQDRSPFQIIIGVSYKHKDDVELELSKIEPTTIFPEWKEITRDMSKKYFDIYGDEIPYRRCDLNPYKRCNHCGDC